MKIDNQQASLESVDILIVEDEAIAAMAMSKLLSKNGYKSTFSLTLCDALEKVNIHSPRLVLLDLRLPDGNGLDAMKQIKQGSVREVIIVSGTDSPDHTRECLRAGAFDFISKPASASEVVAAVRRADAQLKLENLAVGTYPFLLTPGFGSLEGGESQASKMLFDRVKNVARNLDAGGCLITGPAGTLKKDIAASIHHYRNSSDKAYLINCASENDENALLRFAGGARVDGVGMNSRRGYLIEAGEGTVVLDDISSLRMDVQELLVKLLRDREICLIGGEVTIPCSCALIGILREDAVIAIEKGRLSESLYHELVKSTVDVPSLLDRAEDIAFHARKAVEQLNIVFDTEKSLSERFLHDLQEHSWPGNLLELRNLILTAYRLTEPGEEIVDGGPIPVLKQTSISSDIAPFIGTTLRDAERQLIQATLEYYGNNKHKSAKILGVSVKTLYNRLNSFEELVQD